MLRSLEAVYSTLRTNKVPGDQVTELESTILHAAVLFVCITQSEHNHLDFMNITNMHAHARTRTHTHSHVRTHTHTLIYVRTRTHTHTHTNQTPITEALFTHPTPPISLILNTTQTETPTDPEFNPLIVCTSLGGGTFNHQTLLDTELNWKSNAPTSLLRITELLPQNYYRSQFLSSLPTHAALLDGFALNVLGKVATAAVVTNRAEFQEGAQLEGDEPALVEAIKASLQ